MKYRLESNEDVRVQLDNQLFGQLDRQLRDKINEV